MSTHRQVISEVIALVEQQGQPMTLADLSLALGVPPREIRRQVRAQCERADAERVARTPSPEVLVLPADSSDQSGETDEDRVWIAAQPRRDLLGTERLDEVALAPLHRSATELAASEPDNLVLAEATEKLRTGFLPGLSAPNQARADLLGALGRAMGTRQRVRIRYSRAWEPGIFERVIDPYCIAWTRRGPELDAGPVRADGGTRTYQVSRIEALEVLDSIFERPDDADELCARARATTTVSGRVRASRLWVVEQAAEAIRELGREGEWVRFEADLMPPVPWRAGRMVVLAGAGAELDDPALDTAAIEVAQRIWAYHALDEVLV